MHVEINKDGIMVENDDGRILPATSYGRHVVR